MNTPGLAPGQGWCSHRRRGESSRSRRQGTGAKGGGQRSEVPTLSANTAVVALYRANVLETVENPASYIMHCQRTKGMLREAEKRSICRWEQDITVTLHSDIAPLPDEIAQF